MSMIYKSKIINQNNEGMGIAKENNKVTFIPFTLKDEIVNFKIEKEYKKYNEGKLVDVIFQSDERKIPECPYYYECGGCNLMHQKYKNQLEFKKEKVINNLKHISNIDIRRLDIIYYKDFLYRNHVILSVNKDKVGFYKYHTNEVIDIKKCIISNEKINKCIKDINSFVTTYKDNNIDRISIKAYNEVLINIESPDFKLIREFIKYIKFDSLYINNEHICGIKYITANLNKLIYRVSSTDFFQKNTEMTIKLYDYINDLVNKNDNVLDLYCGSGGIGIYVSNKCRSVIGIEVVEEGIENAKANALINNIKNIRFIKGKVEDNLEDIKCIDTIIVDPPRIGLNKKAIDDILKIDSNRIIYVSCNSVTFARDLNLLKDNYKLKSIKLFDLFPNTHHVESVALLEKYL